MPTAEIPEWLEDLRLWVGLELYTPARRADDETTSNPTLAGEIPDWLHGWMTPEKAKPAPQDQASPSARAPAVPVAVPGTSPTSEKPAAVSQSAQPALPSPVSVTSQVFPPVTLEPAIAPPPVAPTVAPAMPTGGPAEVANPQIPADVSVQPVNPPIANTASLAESAAGPPRPLKSLDAILQASGFDLDTGRVVDVEKFHRWKLQHAQSASVRQRLSNASLFETFRKARTAIEAWVDADANHACVMQADPEEIKCKPEIDAILQEYANYGKDMRDKLLRHLEFMVENRRKYHKAMEERRVGNRPG